MLAHIARTYDKGYGHLTTRQNIQYNWPKLGGSARTSSPILAQVEMHAIQTSGNCIRNITTDHFAGVAPDEIVDPRPLAEILRQWSTFHPEFNWLPRKFKIALNGSETDRAAVLLHDIGLHVIRNEAGEVGLRVIVGGGMGRTPIIGHMVRDFLPWRHMLTYCEAILRVYNRYGRRDNIYKARIKILVKSLGVEEFTRQVDAEWEASKDSLATITDEEFARVAAHFDTARVPQARGSRPAICPGAGRQPLLREVGRSQRPRQSHCRIRRGDAVAQENRRAAGRRDCRADGLRRRSSPTNTALASCASRTSRT